MGIEPGRPVKMKREKLAELSRSFVDERDSRSASPPPGKERIGHRTLHLRKRYGDVAGDEDGRLRIRKTPTTRTMMTVTFRPTSMRY